MGEDLKEQHNQKRHTTKANSSGIFVTPGRPLLGQNFPSTEVRTLLPAECMRRFHFLEEAGSFSRLPASQLISPLPTPNKITLRTEAGILNDWVSLDSLNLKLLDTWDSN